MKVHKKIRLLERWLEKIDYELIYDSGIEYWYIYDNKKNNTGWYCCGKADPRLQKDPDISFQYSCSFYLEGVQFYKILNNCVGIRGTNNKDIFLQFYRR